VVARRRNLQIKCNTWRTFLLFDQTKISGLPGKIAILEAPFAGSLACLGAIGQATRDWRGQNGQTLTQSDATNGDFSNPQGLQLIAGSDMLKTTARTATTRAR